MCLCSNWSSPIIHLITPQTYAILIILTLILVRILRLDYDPGPLPGQVYPWWDKWSKYHLIGSGLLGLLSCLLGVPALSALALTWLAGLGWEVVNGYISGGDLVWDGLGDIIGVGLCVLVHYAITRPH